MRKRFTIDDVDEVQPASTNADHTVSVWNLLINPGNGSFFHR